VTWARPTSTLPCSWTWTWANPASHSTPEQKPRTCIDLPHLVLRTDSIRLHVMMPRWSHRLSKSIESSRVSATDYRFNLGKDGAGYCINIIAVRSFLCSECVCVWEREVSWKFRSCPQTAFHLSWGVVHISKWKLSVAKPLPVAAGCRGGESHWLTCHFLFDCTCLVGCVLATAILSLHRSQLQAKWMARYVDFQRTEVQSGGRFGCCEQLPSFYILLLLPFIYREIDCV
jgi:hypothetical protein